MVGFRGSTQEKSTSDIFRFGYEQAVNDKKVPDPVGSEGFLLFLFCHCNAQEVLGNIRSSYIQSFVRFAHDLIDNGLDVLRAFPHRQLSIRAGPFA
jgi:hypothetical protein